MCVVHEPVQAGVGDGGIGDHLVPALDRELAGHDGAAATLALAVLASATAQAGEPRHLDRDLRVGPPPTIQ